MDAIFAGKYAMLKGKSLWNLPGESVEARPCLYTFDAVCCRQNF